MNISVIASTHPEYVATKEELEIFSGHNAGVCYMPNTFADIISEPQKKTNRRITQTKVNGHHSVYDHATINLYLENIPKALAMLINNEKQYTTSEKSGRYTVMTTEGKEKDLYDKWLEIFKTEISNKYATTYPNFFTESKIKTLAQENARYLISMFTPATSMVYSTTYRQLNYLVHMMQREIAKPDTEQNPYYIKLKPAMIDFCNHIKELGYYDEDLNPNAKNRELSFMSITAPVEEYFGTVYCTTYKESFACFGQALRHRSLSYSISLLDTPEYYIPAIIRNNDTLKAEWLKDIDSLKDNYPQGLLVNVHEMGTLDNFILKMIERKCSCVQLEVNETTNLVLRRYIDGLKKINHPRVPELEGYTKGSRCTFKNFTCTSPCGFLEGINETRVI